MASNLDGPREMTAEERLGRTLLAVALTATFCGNVAFVIVRVSTGGGLDPLAILRVPLTIGLCASAWQGFLWARHLAVILFSVGLAGLLLTALSRPNPLALLIAAPFATDLGLLTLSSSVAAFLEYQRTRNNKPRDAEL